MGKRLHGKKFQQVFHKDLGTITVYIRKSDCEIFTDDTFLLSKMINKKHSETELNKDLKLISQWKYQWKMLFNPNPTKQAVFFT